MVIDAGVHTRGWTHERAFEYLTSHTSVTGATAQGEFDRYISWPGKAPSYMIGRNEILALRSEAEPPWATDSTSARSTTPCWQTARCRSRSCGSRWSGGCARRIEGGERDAQWRGDRRHHRRRGGDPMRDSKPSSDGSHALSTPSRRTMAPYLLRYKTVEARMPATVSFATPHHSLECGSTENMYGLIRQYVEAHHHGPPHPTRR